MILNTVIGDTRLQALYEHWAGCRRGRAMPGRADIDPLAIPGTVWPHTMLLDVVRQDGVTRYRYRRTGEIFWQRGLEPRGRFVDDVVPETAGYRQYVIGIYDELVARGRPIYTENVFTLEGRGAPMLTRRVSLPLSKDGEQVDMILGGHVFENGRFDLEYAFSLVTGLKQGVRIILED
jgi:hypothetical protein